MREVQLRIRVQDTDSWFAYQRIGDFGRYPDLVDVIRAVTVHEPVDGSTPSDWEVYFRNGLLRWSEVDRFDPSRLHITFEQTTGDFHVFHGVWRIEPAGADCLVCFDAEFDFGIPSLAGILDPIAAKVLKETIALVVVSLLDRAEVVGDEPIAAAVAARTATPAVA
jgi:ribosome-associated toxin RatA of RatAB toxin-antitoxin module